MVNIEALVMFKNKEKEVKVADLVTGLGGTVKQYINSYGSIVDIPSDKLTEIQKLSEVKGVYTKQILSPPDPDSLKEYPQDVWNGYLITRNVQHNQRAERAKNEELDDTLSQFFS
jgi:hypothetical protein